MHFIDTMILYGKKICDHSFQKEISNDLSAGVWYPAHFYRALQKLGLDQEKKRWVDSQGLFHGYLPSKTMCLTPDSKSPTGFAPFSYQLEQGVSPSEALMKIEQGLSFLDCNQVAFLAFYRALEQELGSSRFNAIFGKKSFSLTPQHDHYLSKLIPAVRIETEEDIQRGDICYFSNVYLYVAKHPAGESRGQHMICSSTAPHRYFGFGLPQEIDSARMDWELLDCYNRDPLDQGYLTQDLWNYLYSYYFPKDLERSKQYVGSFRNNKMSEEQFAKTPSRLETLKLPVKGKLALWVYRPNLTLIEQLKVSADCEHPLVG